MNYLVNRLVAKAVTFLLFWGASSLVWAEVSVIVHPSVAESASASDIERLYLGKTKSLSGGTRVEPLNLAKGNAARDEFNQKVLKKSDSQLKSYWSRLVFTGKAQPPKEVTSEAEAIKLVASDPKAIAYVNSAAVSSEVKVIASF